MAELWPDPVPGAPYTTRSHATLALGSAARRVSDFARSMVPTGPDHAPDQPVGPGVAGIVLADALRLAELAAAVVDAAVVLERESGTSWEEITDTVAARTHPACDPDPDELRRARRHWSAVVEQWRHDLDFAALPGLAGAADLPAVLVDPAEQTAAELDGWVRHRHEIDDPDISVTPVTDRMQQMDPLRELLHLAGLQRLLRGVYPDPPAALIGPIRARETLLNTALAADADDARSPR